MPPIDRSSKTIIAAFSFTYIFGCRPPRWLSHRNSRQPKTYVKPEAAITVFELLMMGGVSPETCWAIKKHYSNKFYYMVASCWFFLWDQDFCLLMCSAFTLLRFSLDSPSNIWNAHILCSEHPFPFTHQCRKSACLFLRNEWFCFLAGFDKECVYPGFLNLATDTCANRLYPCNARPIKSLLNSIIYAEPPQSDVFSSCNPLF
jgi:hypothetical protein